MSGTILSLGSINADFQMRVASFDLPELTPATDLSRLAGGKAGNVAFLARLLGCESRLLGRTGDDDLAEQALLPLRERGVDLSGVRRVAGAGTGLAVVLVPPSGKKRIILAGRANDEWSDDEIAALVPLIDAAPLPALLAVDYEVPAAAVRAATEAAARRGIPVVIDPSLPERAETGVLARATALTPNEAEARRLTGVEQRGMGGAAESAHALRRLGPRLVCVKLAEGGCLLATEDQTTWIPTRGMNVVDTTGAGDAFTGALAVGLLEGRSPCDAVRLAVGASDLAVTAYGAQPSFPTRDRLDAHAGELEPCPWTATPRGRLDE